MTTALTVLRTPTQPQGEDLLAQALAGVVCQHTRTAYATDWRTFAEFLDLSTEDAARFLVSQKLRGATRLVLEYRRALLESDAAPATVNRKLSSVRFLLRQLKRAGIIEWSIDVPGVDLRKVKDTRGPGRETIAEAIAGATVRDKAMLGMMYYMGLRRSEVSKLTLADVERGSKPGMRLWVLGKRRAEKEPFTVPPLLESMIKAWIEERGETPGSLFDVSNSTINRMFQRLSSRTGLRITPHGFRHTAITEVLNKTNGNVREAQQFARHASPVTTGIYDDARTDAFGRLAGLLAEG